MLKIHVKVWKLQESSPKLSIFQHDGPFKFQLKKPLENLEWNESSKRFCQQKVYKKAAVLTLFLEKFYGEDFCEENWMKIIPSFFPVLGTLM